MKSLNFVFISATIWRATAGSQNAGLLAHSAGGVVAAGVLAEGLGEAGGVVGVVVVVVVFDVVSGVTGGWFSGAICPTSLLSPHAVNKNKHAVSVNFFMRKYQISKTKAIILILKTAVNRLTQPQLVA